MHCRTLKIKLAANLIFTFHSLLQMTISERLSPLYYLKKGPIKVYEFALKIYTNFN